MLRCQQFRKCIAPTHVIAINCFVAVLLAGCHSQPVPKADAGTLTPASSPANSLRQIEQLQNTVYFRTASGYCKHNEYGKALGELKQLAASQSANGGLTAVQSAWLAGQEQRCIPHPVRPFARPLPRPANLYSALTLDHYDSCGPRAIRLVCKYLRMPAVSLHVLERVGRTNQHGTSMAGMVRAARAAGFKPLAVQASRQGYSKLPMPAIAWVNGDHYIAVFSMHGKGAHATATVWDPNALAPVTLSQQSLLRMSGGIMLLLKQR